MLSENHKALRNATEEIVEVSVEALAIHLESLVRPIIESDVYDLALKDESKWEPIEIRLWPAEWDKPSPATLYHVVSGNHRTSAAKIKQLPTLRARLIEAPDECSYLIAAISSNTRHGKNFTRDEYIANAKRLNATGMSLAKIAEVLGYSKSVVSRWINDKDSNESRRQQQQDEPVSAYTLEPRATSGDPVKRKVMGLLMDAQLEAEVAAAQAYVRTLKPAQQALLQQLRDWLQEVMG